jgi:Zn-dependent protease with chaperone function
MDFFAQQETARKHTLRLVLLFVAAVVGVIAATDLVVTLGAYFIFDVGNLGKVFHQVLAATILIAIVIFAVRRLIHLRGGGDAIAKMVSARQILRNAESLEERRLLNVVDEMAIASGVTVPSVWVMDKEEGINAFAAGYSPNQAVIVVTHGTLTKLNRDELQGVIGHEFSHILNGDMRLNVRLIGILAGIVVVGEAGLVVIRLGAKAGDSGAIPFIVLGALIAAVGYIGVFFGRMIKAAVSRQREFLADASSVQFTRNPDGLAGALEKIRRGDGTTVGNAYAGEMSHMFFSQAISPKMFQDLLATHPSIDERLASITGRKPEALKTSPNAVPAAQTEAWSELKEAAVAGFNVATPHGRIDVNIARAMLAQVGTATPQHMEHAVRLLAAMPDSLRQSLNSPEGARAAVYAYLISPDAQVRAIQDRALADAGDGAMSASLDDLVNTLQGLGPAARLPVLALVTPALRQMDQSAREVFLIAVDQLVEADHEVTLDEFVIRTVLKRQLSAKASHAERVRFRDIEAVKADVLLLLATLARAGSSDPAAQKLAFARGAARVGFADEIPAVTGTAIEADAMSAALDRLRQLAPLKKPALVLACVDTALADDKLLVAEVELLRTIGMAIDCPLPPTLDAHAVE